jgi:hypothetical protein
LRTFFPSVATFVAGLTLAAAPLAAQTVEFSGQGTSYGTYDVITPGDFSFQYFLPESPAPYASGFSAFSLSNVNGYITQGGVTQATTNDLIFYTTGDFGGFTIAHAGQWVAVVEGPQLFTGTPAAPTFAAGTYTGFTQYSGYTTTVSSVTISPVTTTPEPSSMALLGTGLVALIPMVRRRRK